MVSKGPICDRGGAYRAPTRPADRSTHLMIRIAAAHSMLAWALSVLLLLAGGAPTTDEDARLAGIGTIRAAPDPPPVPHFTDTEFITADGQALPLRKWLLPGG